MNSSKTMRKLIIGMAFSLGSLASHATLVTVDPDAFAAGTDISNAFAGVSLSAVGGGFGSGPVTHQHKQ